MNLLLWIRQLCGFLILSSVLKNLLAQKRYEPYVRLFMNLLLVLLLAQPLMKIDLDRVDGVWQEVAAGVGGGWRQQLVVLAGREETQEQAGRVLQDQLEQLLEPKGYTLTSVRVICDESTDSISRIELEVSPRNDYLRNPVIWKENAAYTGKESSDDLKCYLEEAMKLAADVELAVTIE